VVFHFELHEAHVGWVGEFGYDTESWKKPLGNSEERALGSPMPPAERHTCGRTYLKSV